ncbi:hypothetical protein RvY_07357 [Ramazzottius varieornatus]|uniref:G-protein coupled receptors family 1 profile domain-containing protein n=1 Tax=Ramazzottius varieornatus TaxID=947166 RepID=A0A1D1V6V8_RAMVA|nr:hypothetical protein RvY_07357 [Ramazzottius varieornatus]
MYAVYPVFVYSGTGVDEEPLEPANDFTRTQCNILWPPSETLGIDGSKQFALYGFVLGFALPVALMVTFYGMVLRRLRNSHEKVTETTTSGILTATPAHSRRRSKLRRVTMMIFVLVLVYVVCWTPYWGVQIHIIFADATEGESTDIIVASLSLQCLCFFNSACNPLLYAILSDNFKKSYSRALKKLSHEKHREQTSPLVLVNGKPRNSWMDSDGFLGEPTIASVSAQPHVHIRVKPQKDVLFRVGDEMLVLL